MAGEKWSEGREGRVDSGGVSSEKAVGVRVGKRSKARVSAASGRSD